jgi:predicted phosphodiesterase
MGQPRILLYGAVMPVAIVSDIHGNLPALEAVVADAEARGCKSFFNLGDLLSGPLWPAETADYLMASAWLTIRGNHERQLLTGDSQRMNRSDAYAFGCLSEEHLNWLRALPATMELPSEDIFLCHGTPASDLIYFMEDVDEAGWKEARPDQVADRAGSRAERLLLCGHTHVPRVLRLGDGRTIANPGSVGLQAYDDDKPFPHAIEIGTPHARYAILDQDRQVELVAIDYDHEAAARQADRNGRPDWAYALLHGRMPTS